MTRGWFRALPIVLLVGTLTGCGGGEPAVMPDVTERRLDVALSDIERAGFEDEVEVLGGGMFGVVDESNWTVCDQEPTAGTEVDAAPRLTVDRSCGRQDKMDGGESASSGSGDTGGKRLGSKGNKDAPADSGGAAETFVMPALVGMVLQDAQDKLQSVGSYLLTQTDATGMERFQVDDDNWKVCFQDPAPGATVKASRLVELGAVQLDEQCP